MSEIKRYATRGINIDGIDYNAGDIIPMHVQVDDDSDAIRYEGKTPSAAAKKAATKEARQDLEDVGLTSASFQEEKITTKTPEGDEDAKVLLADGDDAEVETTEVKEETTEVETEQAPARGRGRNAQSE